MCDYICVDTFNHICVHDSCDDICGFTFAFPQRGIVQGQSPWGRPCWCCLACNCNTDVNTNANKDNNTSVYTNTKAEKHTNTNTNKKSTCKKTN